MITALFWLLDHIYQANSCLKKQSRALAVDNIAHLCKSTYFSDINPQKDLELARFLQVA